jgi:acyl-CoA synthetase (AMP-forming)/AMP-acid ligase II
MPLLMRFDQHADKTAVYWGGESITYTQVFEQSEWVRQYLVDECNLKPGDRVALWMKNTPEFISILFGALRAGAVVVPLNHFLTAPEAGFILKDAGAKVIFIDDAMAQGAASVRETLPELNLCHIRSREGLAPTGFAGQETHCRPLVKDD